MTGYFISPSGDIIPIEGRHIDNVVKYPEKFRLTREDIVEVYKKYNEKMGLEGKARGEILSNLMKSGWIRIRYLPEKDSFSIQVSALNNKNKKHIYQFADMAIEGIRGTKYSPHTEAVIMNLNAEVLGTHSLGELAKDVLYKEARIITMGEYMTTKLSFDMSRIYKYYRDKNFGIVSAYLDKFSKKENVERQEELKKDVREMGYGFKEIKGAWRTGIDEKISFEYALFIPLLKSEDAIKLGKKYEQYAVIYADKDKQAVVLDKLGNGSNEVFDSLKGGFEDSWISWSEFKRHKFKFSSVEWFFDLPIDPPRGFFEAVGYESFKNDRGCSECSSSSRRASIIKKVLHRLLP